MKRFMIFFESLAVRLWTYQSARVGVRLVVLALLLRFSISAVQAFLVFHTFNYLVLLVGEFVTLGLVVFARDTVKVSLNFVSVLAAFSGSFYYLFFDLESSARALIPLSVAELVQLLGIAFQIFAKLSLGRSFGLVAANRGVVVSGAYRIVRHPIYMGYLIGHVGFILSAFSLYNFLVLIFLYSVQVVRIFEEERVLRQDPIYAQYMESTHWRIIPGVF